MCSSIAGWETSDRVKLKQRAVGSTLIHERSCGFLVHRAHFYPRGGGQAAAPSSRASCQRPWGGNQCWRTGGGKTLPLTPLTSLAHPLYIWSLQILTSCFLQTGGRTVGRNSLDFVGNVVRYYPVALALHSCMVPIGVPASMRTRTQTVNHLCIF